MIKELITYPDERIRYVSADVRKFDDELFELLENMRHTMEHHGLGAIAAIQIAIPACAVLVNTQEGVIELINPRIIAVDAEATSEEQSAYYPDFTVPIRRHESVKIVYENRYGESCHLDIGGEVSRTLQRKIDMLFGGTLLDKLDKKKLKEAEKLLKKRIKKRWWPL